MLDALHQSDLAARAAALTELDRTLLVEAGAGSGKTSVLAGRVACLLAAGRKPERIAAITFTELAAGELRERVCAFVTELAEGRVRPDMAVAFPDGPSPKQRKALRDARRELDQLTCTTIHGFCQRLLTPYPVEAGMDPGAAVMDRDASDALFQEVLEAWLRERLAGPRRDGDVLVGLYLADPDGTGVAVRDVACKLKEHRGAAVPEAAGTGGALDVLRDAVRAFRLFLEQAPCVEEGTEEIAAGLEALLRAAPCGADVAQGIYWHLRLAVPACCARADGGFREYKRLGKWRAAVKTARCKASPDDLNDRATAHYEACRAAHAAVRSHAAAQVLHLVAKEVEPVLARFVQAKRDAALVDFDDLLTGARDLLARNPAVRAALGRRFAHVLVDEFQDTDPLQCEILWRLCGEGADGIPWSEITLRPGALFLVGDPKQAIYRFRNADVATYVAARERLAEADGAACVAIVQSFRSLAGILEWVNGLFEAPLSGPGQPGFARLFTRAAAPDDHVPVAALPIHTPEKAKSDVLRDTEAEVAAELCARLVGALQVRGDGAMRACRPSDIALLAPTGAELWRYERALEDRGLAVSTQAGKGYFRRQEVQDLIALVRALADPADTLALGALLRGPLVGLTEEELLDAVAGLPERDGRPGRLWLWTSPEEVAPGVLRETLGLLQGLARAVDETTPFVLLCRAIEELQIRPVLRQRQGRTAERALANVDQFLEAARAYDVRGLHAFARMVRAQWETASRAIEGRPDTEQHAVSLVTVHSAKGLEWPVVLPINTATSVKHSVTAALDRDGRLHMTVFGVHPPGCEAALAAEREEHERERMRLWYVATTRARDLLLLPDFIGGTPDGSWRARIGAATHGLPAFATDGLPPAVPSLQQEGTNLQDAARHAREAAAIRGRTRQIVRITPHRADGAEEAGGNDGTVPILRAAPAEGVTEPERPRGSLARGLVLHKLLEELLTGEVPMEAAALASRAATLSAELAGVEGADRLDPAEAADAALRGLSHPEIATLRQLLVPECRVAAAMARDGVEHVTLGIADAVALRPDGTIAAVVDWKSDVAPTEATVAQYRAQVRTYVQATGAAHGKVVFLTSGRVEHVLP